jgi:hypothetical protein
MPRNKLTLDQVLEILREHSSTPSRQVAMRYGVSRCAITHLRRGWSWKTQLKMLQETGHLSKSLWNENAPPRKIYKKTKPTNTNIVVEKTIDPFDLLPKMIQDQILRERAIKKPEDVQNTQDLNAYVSNLVRDNKD